jgi:hypothetical protein
METAVAGAEAGKLSGANSRRASRGSIDVPKIEPEQAPKMTAEQTRLLFRSADGPETAPAASTREMPPEKPPAVATMGSVYSGATAGCATERVPRQSSSSSRSSTNPPQTARPNASPKSASNVVGSASTETVGAVAMGLRVAALSGNLPPHIPPLISAWSAELAEQHRRPAYERAIRNTLDLYPTPRSRPVSSLSPRQRATAACEPPEPPELPEPPRPSSMIKVPPLTVPEL